MVYLEKINKRNPLPLLSSGGCTVVVGWIVISMKPSDPIFLKEAPATVSQCFSDCCNSLLVLGTMFLTDSIHKFNIINFKICYGIIFSLKLTRNNGKGHPKGVKMSPKVTPKDLKSSLHKKKNSEFLPQERMHQEPEQCQVAVEHAFNSSNWEADVGNSQ